MAAMVPCRVTLNDEHLPTDVTCASFQPTIAVKVIFNGMLFCKCLPVDIIGEHEQFAATMEISVPFQVMLTTKRLPVVVTYEKFVPVMGDSGDFQAAL